VATRNVSDRFAGISGVTSISWRGIAHGMSAVRRVIMTQRKRSAACAVSRNSIASGGEGMTAKRAARRREEA